MEGEGFKLCGLARKVGERISGWEQPDPVYQWEEKGRRWREMQLGYHAMWYALNCCSRKGLLLFLSLLRFCPGRAGFNWKKHGATTGSCDIALSGSRLEVYWDIRCRGGLAVHSYIGHEQTSKQNTDGEFTVAFLQCSSPSVVRPSSKRHYLPSKPRYPPALPSIRETRPFKPWNSVLR